MIKTIDDDVLVPVDMRELLRSAEEIYHKICRVFDAHEDEVTVAIAVEALGMALALILRDDPRPEAVLEVMTEKVLAVIACHKQHRDDEGDDDDDDEPMLN